MVGVGSNGKESRKWQGETVHYAPREEWFLDFQGTNSPSCPSTPTNCVLVEFFKCET